MSGMAIHLETGTAPTLRRRSLAGVAESLDRWLQSNAVYLVTSLLLVGFALRCCLASVAPINPDEAYYYLIGQQPTVYDTWKQSLTQVHPPLFFLLVRYWAKLGCSETFLRLLPATAGTLAAFMMYKWISILLSRPAGFFALVFGTLSPSLLALSIELRQYSLLLLFAVCSLYFFHLQRYWLAAVFSSLAVLTHYSAVFLLPYFPILLLIRHRSQRGPGRLLAYLACVSLLLPAAIFVLLYFTHIRTFSAREMTHQAKEDWLASDYFDHGNETAPSFLTKRSYAVIVSQYSLPIITPRRGGRVLALKYMVIGAVLVFSGIWAWRTLARESATELFCYSIAAFLMFLLAGMLAILGYYPFGPTRHSSILLVFTLPVASLLVSEFSRRRPSHALALSICLMSALLLYRGSLRPLADSNGRKAAMAQTAVILKGVARDRGIVFSDYGSALVMNYYLQPRGATIDFIDEPAGRFHDYWLGSVHIVCSSVVGWSSADALMLQVAALRNQRHFADGIYVVNAGWAHSLAPAINSSRLTRVQWLVRAENPEVFWMAFDAFDDGQQPRTGERNGLGHGVSENGPVHQSQSKYAVPAA